VVTESKKCVSATTRQVSGDWFILVRRV